MVLLSKREEVDLCPNLPDFKSFFGQVPPLGRRLRVACPCTGVHACGYALQEMSVAADTNNVFDLEDAYWSALHKHLTSMGMQKVVLNLGKTAGDLLKVELDRLELPVDCLISGPPCPPWAACGNKKGQKDKRAQVFVRVLEWVYVLIKNGGLLIVVLENVEGTLNAIDGLVPAMTKFVKVLRERLPEFMWSVDTLKLEQYKVPHSRIRVFLRGVRKLMCDSVPAPLKPFGTSSLRSFLGPYPHTPRTRFTQPQRENLEEHEQRIRNMVSDGKLQMHDIVVVAADRSQNKAWNASISINVCPTLTTCNQYLVCLSVHDVVHRTPDSQREFFRKIHDCERLLLQSLPPSLYLDLPTGLL